MCGKDCVVIAVEKKSIPVLQDDRTIRKIHQLDDHVLLAFAGETYLVQSRNCSLQSGSSPKHKCGFLVEGLNADARVLVNMARVECQSFKLTNEDPVTVEYITKHVARTKQVHKVHLVLCCIYNKKLFPSALHWFGVSSSLNLFLVRTQFHFRDTLRAMDVDLSVSP